MIRKLLIILNLFQTLLMILAFAVRLEAMSECPQILNYVNLHNTNNGMPSDWYRKMGDIIIPLENGDLFLGIMNGHTYLSYKGIRVDGEVFKSTHAKKLGTTHLDDRGIVFRIHLSGDESKELSEALSKKYFGITCSEVSCRIIKNAGFEWPISRIAQLFPGLTIWNLSKYGVKNKDGKLLPMTIYQLGSSNLRETIKSNLITDAIIPGSFVLMVGGVVYVIYADQNKSIE